MGVRKIMRGQIQSGSRRLNKHWQSSDNHNYRYGIFNGSWDINDYFDYDSRQVDKFTVINISDYPFVTSAVPATNTITRQFISPNKRYQIIGNMGYDEEPYQAFKYYNYEICNKNKVPSIATYKASLNCTDISFIDNQSFTLHSYDTAFSVDILFFNYPNRSHGFLSPGSIHLQGQAQDDGVEFSTSIQQLLNTPVYYEDDRIRCRGTSTYSLNIYNIKETQPPDFDYTENYLLTKYHYVYYSCTGSVLLNDIGTIQQVLSGKVHIKIGAI